MRRTFTNTCLKLGIEMWKTEMLTSPHVPTTTTLLHYTDTADLRESCADEVQAVANWIEPSACHHPGSRLRRHAVIDAVLTQCLLVMGTRRAHDAASLQVPVAKGEFGGP